jgi:hypothetical protein
MQTPPMQANFIHLQLLRITDRGSAVRAIARRAALPYQRLISQPAKGNLRSSSDPI